VEKRAELGVLCGRKIFAENVNTTSAATTIDLLKLKPVDNDCLRRQRQNNEMLLQ